MLRHNLLGEVFTVIVIDEVFEGKVFVSKREIESWYLAGFSQDNAEKYKVKFIYCTDDISKEKFRSMVPKDFNPVSFQVEILKSFDTVLATMRNRSFNIFCTK